MKNKNSTSSCPFSSGVNTLEETRVLDLQPSVTLLTDEDPQTNVEHQESPCVCQVIPCVCLASQPADGSQPPPKLKLTKSDGVWKSSDTTNPTSSQPPLCPCCDVPLQDHQHKCDAAGDQPTEKQQESASDQCPDENDDVVKNKSLSSSKKPLLKRKSFLF